MTAVSLSQTTSDILIVDDVLDNLVLLSEILSQAGFSVRKAINGTMALTAVKAAPPDLILLDINMPGLDGYEVCAHLKATEETQSIPIIFLSALDAMTDKVKAFDLGAADYITKPFYQEEVLKRIQNQLQIRHLTQQLAAQNQILKTALDYLKENQADIIQHEKMSGLNQMIGGVAHEINNPVTFIAGNVNHAQDYFEVLHDTVQRYQNQCPDLDAGQPNEELEFVCSDFPKVLESMQTGAERIGDIVQALQTFARHQEEGYKATNLHETLDSILVLLRPQLRSHKARPAIALTCDYGTLPLVTCDAQQIGQVLLNLLQNAIEAIEALWESDSSPLAVAQLPPPAIAIRTYSIDSQWIAIAVQDTGIGIADEIRPRVYEPFFSTKPIGDGKGLGLTMSYRIITDNHGGQLSFETAERQGTTFVLKLPLAHPDAGSHQ